MNIKSSTVAKDEFYDLLKQVNDKEEPIIISSSNNQRDAVIIGKKQWNSIQETLYLESTGTMNKIRERLNDNSGYTDIDDIDWARL
ncbi:MULTISPECIES: type II toxin-antitoxin system Phd/YefM family antitoxin [Staphylococcus]|uniref:type II toxin-antitoxin system Phd/YefM family antitoxin n=1 Tax=Staphylococcus TaxID=1279 RepID=UPI0018E43381|nr:MULTISPECIES: type II toxin-antitoxin system Phd/YefM family antitoxin [Staphylococcus]MBI5972978.1 type II toxin-antitoxin system Phd/YefM family antitoxin [Staphylococcus caledonicus]MCI2946976.1 type II toxin-antitoxin system Phd/YefM family antitoxin [Staphylococcus sp. acrmy]